ncbi:hypothetical protein [Halobacterium sp. CBA1126]|uniref:hypothetical protein n=1 Tax=Halobacterium TaxID=2239 RepID=UPI0012FACD38|nr:hypothetical protein [Halobacterium sp. CBA1126]MUV59748.1 hypothetical protein [Halobacterium sp. CBA1126]
MPARNDSGLTSLDVGAMRDAVEATVDGTLRSLVEFTADDFALVYADDVTRSFYDDEAHMLDHFEEIHSYVHIDFTETDFFTDRLFPVADDVRYHATSLDAFTLVRVYFDDEGLFVALDNDEPVEPVVAAVEDVHAS